MITKADLTGVILAGGEGRRMDGRDKGWIELAGKPMVELVLKRLAPQVNSCMISANRNLERYRALNVPVVNDGDVYLGPLAGIVTALEAMSTDFALVVPTDAPLLPIDLAQLLMESGTNNLVICHDGERLQPLFGLYHRSLAPSIREYLASGQRQLTRWSLSRQPEIVTISDTFAFSNLNTETERTRIEALLH